MMGQEKDLLAKQNNLQDMKQHQPKEQLQDKRSEQTSPISSKKQFLFSFSEEQKIDKELKKPRSRAYMELFDAIDMLSATDEEIIEQLKANMDEDTADEFSNMTTEELLEEIRACFQEEFENLEIELESILCGVVSKCYIEGCDCHAISPEGRLIDHFKEDQELPEELEKGRIVYKMYPQCRCVEVYNDCCRVIDTDSSVIRISDDEIS
ncbi:MAG: hypothetical protein IKW30_07820 [Lachnospiraceae bacterium]|nr:hypothetical protein [Lachnospiraceae bacterium]